VSGSALPDASPHFPTVLDGKRTERRCQPRRQPTAASLAAPLAEVDELELREAVAAFGRDVLNGWAGSADDKVKVWESPTDRKDYSHRSNGKRRVTPSDVLAHLRGEKIIAVGPVRRALVIDHDLPGVATGEDADEASKDAARGAVTTLLDSFGIPHLHTDGARGVHTWIRLDRHATAEERAALLALLNGAERHHALAATRATFEVYPSGGRALRLPFGCYIGKPRGAVPERSVGELLRWLSDPERATDDQLELLVAAAPNVKPGPPVQDGASKPRGPLSATSRTIPGANDATAPPAPIEGWERWPACKREVAVEGPLANKRNATLLALANEAVESGERDAEKIVRLLDAMPRPHSTTSAQEHHREAVAAVEGAFRLFEANDARRLSGCPHIPHHSGNPTTSSHRDAIQHACTPEAAAVCPIFQRWQKSQTIPAFAYVLQSSIWRDGSGQYGLGLGNKAKEVYRFLLARSGGDPAHSFEASQRYIEAHLIGTVRREGIRDILSRLLNIGLVEHVSDDWPIYRVPHRNKEWVDALARELGTDTVDEKQRDELRRHWESNKHFRSRD
jgi:hypothetical protein